jgi:excisionase family DNA binding protein
MKHIVEDIPRRQGSAMTTHQDTDWLSIREAGRLLKVSRTTIHRWLKDGRLRAYRVGPKAVRIHRADLERVVSLVQPDGEEVTRMTEARPMPIHTSLATITPLTDEQQRRALDALKASQELLERMRARWGGKPFDESWPMIREAREERSKRLL